LPCAANCRLPPAHWLLRGLQAANCEPP
jgi:hypothetical protein